MAVEPSIREFGFRQPIVVDENGVIIVGHSRFKAALKLGLTEVPVHVAAGLSPARRNGYGLPASANCPVGWSGVPASCRLRRWQ